MKKMICLIGCVLIVWATGCGQREFSRSTERDSAGSGPQDTEQYSPHEPDASGETESGETDSAESGFRREYQDSPYVTRDDLALVFSWHFERFFPRGRRPPVIIDIDRSSQQEALLSAAAAGLIPVGRDHRILPGSRVRKQDVSRAVWRIMELAGVLPDESLIDPSVLPYDVTASHSAWKEVAGSLVTGVLKTEPDGYFHPGRIMTGSRVLDAVDALNTYLSHHGK
jgi:hypothetical protein